MCESMCNEAPVIINWQHTPHFVPTYKEASEETIFNICSHALCFLPPIHPASASNFAGWGGVFHYGGINTLVDNLDNLGGQSPLADSNWRTEGTSRFADSIWRTWC